MSGVVTILVDICSVFELSEVVKDRSWFLLVLLFNLCENNERNFLFCV